MRKVGRPYALEKFEDWWYGRKDGAQPAQYGDKQVDHYERNGPYSRSKGGLILSSQPVERNEMFRKSG